MEDKGGRTGIFAGDDPFALFRDWMAEAEKSEINDPNAIAIASVDGQGMPNVRMVLLKEVEADAFVFYTNYNGVKGQEILASGKAAFVIHWKSLHRQIRVRGHVEKEDGPQADAYYNSRALQSRIGAWASEQSRPLDSRGTLIAQAAKLGLEKGLNPSRPPFWGGFRIRPTEIEFWADGDFRLHDRFRWTRETPEGEWSVTRLNP
ncbi:pyridoxamine 5'-phosphate oxidase [Pontivivens insulae]|uniref:Pyridoxine/pyridoxamine 5'-phosphate oxidase n=1 Tax=Pontivivens insulae TaxID=1639689 RepID=A0A2R8ACH9_9RHOB|nr:pyridoxamine 5'-phosphate oxidase [Pontivivens insulae]RED11030.1 pyridoxamine 5'-phosphate oxidase [Pontivivens insulae]SPF29795.1 Pyridoxine/pyridoxamine 5'-phosphate oxidase [Pontivivens insulae]